MTIVPEEIGRRTGQIVVGFTVVSLLFVASWPRSKLLLTLDVLPETHGGGDVLTLAARLLLHHVVVAGHVARRCRLLRLALLMARWQLLGEGEHGKDDQEHGDGAQEEAAPPGSGWDQKEAGL